MSTAPINPRGFHTHGKQFFAATEAVFSSAEPPILPLAFLWGRSVELLLKSYLLAQGMTPDQLRSRKFGHNLVALHTEAQARGIDNLIGTDLINSRLVRLLNLDYVSKRLEYRESGANYSLLDAELARRVIGRLLRGVDFHLRQRGI
jgi:hypothetical protein